MDKKHELFPRVHSRLQATEEPADKMQAFEGIHVTEGTAAETTSINTAYSTCRLYPAALCYLVWGIKSFYPLHHLGIECWKQKIMEITEVRSLCPSDWGEIFQITGNINHYLYQQLLPISHAEGKNKLNTGRNDGLEGRESNGRKCHCTSCRTCINIERKKSPHSKRLKDLRWSSEESLASQRFKLSQAADSQQA